MNDCSIGPPFTSHEGRGYRLSLDAWSSLDVEIPYVVDVALHDRISLMVVHGLHNPLKDTNSIIALLPSIGQVIDSFIHPFDDSLSPSIHVNLLCCTFRSGDYVVAFVVFHVVE